MIFRNIRRNAARFRGDESAASALEFALVMPILLALVFSTFEAGWIMTQKTMLARSLDKTIRLIRVGASNAPKTQENMKKAICKEASFINDCSNMITVEMTQITSASDFPTSSAKCIDRSKSVQPTVNFTPGVQSSIMYVRACVTAKPFMPGLGFGLALQKDSTGAYNYVATGAFMNEPSL